MYVYVYSYQSQTAPPAGWPWRIKSWRRGSWSKASEETHLDVLHLKSHTGVVIIIVTLMLEDMDVMLAGTTAHLRTR